MDTNSFNYLFFFSSCSLFFISDISFSTYEGSRCITTFEAGTSLETLAFQQEITGQFDSQVYVTETVATLYSALGSYYHAIENAFSLGLADSYPESNVVRLLLMDYKYPNAVGDGTFLSNGRSVLYYYLKSFYSGKMVKQYPTENSILLYAETESECTNGRTIIHYDYKSEFIGFILLFLGATALATFMLVLFNLNKDNYAISSSGQNIHTPIILLLLSLSALSCTYIVNLPDYFCEFRAIFINYIITIYLSLLLSKVFCIEKYIISTSKTYEKFVIQMKPLLLIMGALLSCELVVVLLGTLIEPLKYYLYIF